MKVRPAYVALMLAVIAIMLTAAMFLTFDSWFHFWLISLISAAMYGVAISGTIGCIAIYNMQIDTFLSKLGPEDLRRRVVFHLRGIGYRVEDKDRYLVVPLDPNRTARIRFEGTASGSETAVRPGLTSSGIALMFCLIVFVPFGAIGALAMAFNSYRMTTEFGKGWIAPTVEFLENQKEDLSVAPGLDLKLVMIDTLLHADRLATEAVLALKASYDDSVWMTVGLGTIVYVMGLFGLEGAYHLMSTDPPVFWFSLIGAIAVVTGLVWHFRTVYYLRSNKVRRQVNDIRASIAREQGMMPASEDDESALSLILRIWPELPTWAKYRRKNFYQRNPVKSIAIAVLLMAAWQSGGFGAIGFFARSSWSPCRPSSMSGPGWRTRARTGG